MRKESEKKNKLWLWIVIPVAILAILGGVFAAFVLPGLLNDNSGSAIEAKLYWNIDGYLWLDKDTNTSTREPGEDGLYHLRYLADGEVKEYICADKRLVNFLDSMDAICLGFDRDGYIVDALPATTYFTAAAKELYLQKFDNGVMTLNSSIDMGAMELTFNIPEGFPIWDVSAGSAEPGKNITPDFLDVITVYNDLEGNLVAIYVTGHKAIDAEVGWRVERMYADGNTSRIPDKNGVYTIDFAIDGKVVQRYCKNADLVRQIDARSNYYASFALEYDEEGFIIDYESPQMQLRGKKLCEGFNVDAVDGKTVTATRYLSGDRKGETIQFTYDETCDIYQCCVGCCWDEHCGERITDLQPGDLVQVFSDVDGKPLLIYVALRGSDSPMVWNIKQRYNTEKKETSRTPDENGYYVYDIYINGKQKQVRTKSKELATQVDYYGNAMTMTLSGSIIKKVSGVQCSAGRERTAAGYFVISHNTSIVSVAPISRLSAPTGYLMAPDCKIYIIAGDYTIKQGSKADLKVNDKVNLYTNERGEISYIWITQRHFEGYSVAYNLKRQYNATLGETKRVPDANGYYVFDVAYNGKQIQLKTKNKDIASFVDKQSPNLFGFKQKNGVITSVCLAISTLPHGMYSNSNGRVETTEEGKLVTSLTGSSTLEKKISAHQYRLLDNVKIYNVSNAYDKFKGEKSKLKKGDKVVALTDQSVGIHYVFILNKYVNSPIYWHGPAGRAKTKLVDGVRVTAREADENGYYVYELLVNGKLKTFKTKNPDAAVNMDAYDTGFALELEKDGVTIKRYLSYEYTSSCNMCDSFDVTSIDGDIVTLTRNLVGSSNYLAERRIKVDSKTKVYNVSPYAKNWGAKDKIGIGDRVVVYYGVDCVADYIYITKENTRTKGIFGKCSHCNKKVFWEAYTENLSVDGVHYYLPADTVRAGTFGSATDDKIFDQVLDLNGHNLTAANGVPIEVNDKLTIIDSVGGGKVTGGKASMYNSTYQGGNIYVREGGTLVLDGVTVDKGNATPSGVGSNIAANNGTVVLNNCNIGTGVGYLGTSVYHTGTKGGVTINGGKITGSVYADKLTLKGAPKIANLIVAPGTRVNLGTLKSGAQITVKADGVFTTTSANIATYAAYFKPANSADKIVVENGALKYINNSGAVIPEVPNPNEPLQFKADGKTAMCMACGEEVEWTAIHNGENIGNMQKDKPFVDDPSGTHYHYYLAEDILAKDSYFLYGYNAKRVCLHLNGKNAFLPGGFYCANQIRLNVLGEGKVRFLGNSASGGTANGAMFTVYTAYVNLLGGDYFSTTKPVIEKYNSNFNLTISHTAKIWGKVSARDSGGYPNINLSEKAIVQELDFPNGVLNIKDNFSGSVKLLFGSSLLKGNEVDKNAVIAGKNITATMVNENGKKYVAKNGGLVLTAEDGVMPAAPAVPPAPPKPTAPLPEHINDPLVFDADGKTAMCYACNEKVKWTVLPETLPNAIPDGTSYHYYLAADQQYNDNYLFRIVDAPDGSQKANTYCLHFNGHSLTTKGCLYGGYGSTTNLMGNGTMTYTGTDNSMLSIHTASLNVYGAKLISTEMSVCNSYSGTSIKILGDSTVSGAYRLTQGRLSIAHNASMDNLIVSGSGAMNIAHEWNGTLKLNPDQSVLDGDYIKQTAATLDGDVLGTITTTAGRAIEKDGELLKLAPMGAIPEDVFAPEAYGGQSYCPGCKEVVSWTALENKYIGATNGVTMHYYLTGNLTHTTSTSTTVAIYGGSKVCLHLNGYTYTAKQILNSNGTLKIYGSNGGKINFTGSAAIGFSNKSNGRIELYGGTYTYPNKDADKYVIATTSNEVHLYDATVVGNVHIEYKAARLKLNGTSTVDGSFKFTISSGYGYLTLEEGWNGTLILEESAAEHTWVNGTLAGTVTTPSNEAYVQDGNSLKLPSAQPPEAKPTYKDNLTFAAGTTDAYCPGCETTVTWTALENKAYAVTSASHYYLASDLIFTNSEAAAQAIKSSKGTTVCLHLNGNTYTTAHKIYAVNGTLNVYGGDNGAIVFNANSSGVGFTQGETTTTINLYGGTYSYTGGNALYNWGTYNLYDATVNGNVYYRGNGSSVNLYGTSTINGSHTFHQASGGLFGNIVLKAGWNGELVLTEAEAAKVIVEGETLNGTVKTADNRYFEKDGNGLKLAVVQPPVTTPTYKDNLTFAAGTTDAYCPGCEKTVTWTALADQTYAVSSGSHYYLADNLTFTNTEAAAQAIKISGGAKLCLHLNGKTYTTAHRITAVSGTLNVYSGNGGAIVFNDNTSGVGFTQGTTGITYNLYGGTYTYSGTAEDNIIYNFGVVNLYDATVNGNVYHRGDGSSVNLYGTSTINGSHTFHQGSTGLFGNIVLKEGWKGVLTLTEAEAAKVTVEGATLEGTVKTADGMAFVKDGTGLKLAYKTNLAFATGTTDAYCPGCKKVVTWTALADQTYAVSSASHYYLAGDLTFTNSMAATQAIKISGGAKLCLHLNGKTYTTAHKITAVSGSLNVYGGNGGAIVFNDNASSVGFTQGTTGITYNLYGGTYTYSGTAEDNIIYNFGVYNLYDATVNGNVYHRGSGSSVNLYGASTINGTHTFHNGSFGKIVLKEGWNGTLVLTEAEIAKVTVEGEAMQGSVRSNTGVPYEQDGTTLAPAAYLRNLSFAAGTTDAYCPGCKKIVTWTALEDVAYANIAAGHYYLANSMTLTNSGTSDGYWFKLGSARNVCLHLNGNTLTSPLYMYAVSGTLNVYGGNGGAINFTGKPGYYISQSNTQMNLFGGTYRNTSGIDGAYVVKLVSSKAYLQDVIVDGDVTHSGQTSSVTYAGSTTVNGENLFSGSTHGKFVLADGWCGSLIVDEAIAADFDVQGTMAGTVKNKSNVPYVQDGTSLKLQTPAP